MSNLINRYAQKNVYRKVHLKVNHYVIIFTFFSVSLDFLNSLLRVCLPL